jgi:hypothetical protein
MTINYEALVEKGRIDGRSWAIRQGYEALSQAFTRFDALHAVTDDDVMVLCQAINGSAEFLNSIPANDNDQAIAYLNGFIPAAAECYEELKALNAALPDSWSR